MAGPQDFQDRLHSASRFPHVAGWMEPTDPAVTKPDKMHPGIFWIDTSPITPPWSLKVRNAANTGWEDVGTTGGGGGGSGGHQIVVNGVVMPQRSILAFEWPGVVGIDDGENDTTIIQFVGEEPGAVLTLGGEGLVLGGEYITLGS